MMRMSDLLLRTAIAILVCVQISNAQMPDEEVDHAPPISMITLIAEPTAKNPQRVQVAGFLVLDFEGEALYLHEEDYRHGLTRNAIRVALTPDQMNRYKDLARTYVWVQGSFRKRRASEDLFSGSLFDIREIRKAH